MQTQQPEIITLGGIDDGSRPQIVTILSELVNAHSSSMCVDLGINLGSERDKLNMSVNSAAEFMAKNITAVRVKIEMLPKWWYSLDAICFGTQIKAEFSADNHTIIQKASAPANFSTAADLRAALMRVFVLSRKTVFGYAKISAMPNVMQSDLITQIEFIKYLNPKSTTISVVYPSEYRKEAAYVIVKNFLHGNTVQYARYEMSATDLNKALYGSHIYGEITLPETVLDKLISSY
jgi:hypothetical protein